MRNYGPAVLYLLFKSINPDTRIGVSNLRDEIHKSTLAKFINNVKTLLMTFPQITLSLLIK